MWKGTLSGFFLVLSALTTSPYKNKASAYIHPHIQTIFFLRPDIVAVYRFMVSFLRQGSTAMFAENGAPRVRPQGLPNWFALATPLKRLRCCLSFDDWSFHNRFWNRRAQDNKWSSKRPNVEGYTGFTIAPKDTARRPEQRSPPFRRRRPTGGTALPPHLPRQKHRG